MYKENSAGNGIVWLAEDNDKIVGHYAIVPVLMNFGSYTLIGAQSLDTMTHPDYRYQGIFETLAKAVYKEAANKGINIIYGLPNQFSHHGLIKLDWVDVRNMQMMLKPFNWRNALNLKIKNRFLQVVLATGAGLIFNEPFWRIQKTPAIEGLNITQITSFDERFDEFWTTISNQSQIMVVRNRDYLSWRYSTPDTNYSIFAAEKDHRISGYMVLLNKMRKDVKGTIICDLMFQSEEIMPCLISTAIEESRQKGADFILYYSITNKTYQRILKKNGFISLPFIMGQYLCIYSSSPSISKEFLSNPQNWLIQPGDSDAV